MNQEFLCSRRQLLTGAAGLTAGLALPRPAAAASVPLNVRTTIATVPLRVPATPVWHLETQAVPRILRYRQGDELQVAFTNDTPAPAVLNWSGIDGVAAAEPLTGQAPLAPSGRANFTLPLRHAGSFLLDARLLGDGRERPSTATMLIVEEQQKPVADKDAFMLIEDWRLNADNTALAPGIDPKDATPLFTFNGLPKQDITMRPNERVRLRIFNGCHRSVFGLKIENHDVRVMAVDGQPAEPYPARDGQLILAPGTRLDVMIDATMPAGSSAPIMLFGGGAPFEIARLVTNGEPIRPVPLPLAAAFPSNGLPTELRFQNALRAELAFDGAVQGDWAIPGNFALTSAPLFKAKRGRVVMLNVLNRAPSPIVMRLHGHHARVLDRLDDGWKPYWIDTLLLDTGQTQRIAFLAEHAGNWLIETMQIGWSSPKLVRWFAVEN